MTYPATYELDTGHVRPYCSHECQQRDLPNVPTPNVAEDTGGEDCMADGHFSCCCCGRMVRA